MAPDRLTYLWAAEQIIRRHARPLSAAEIITLAQESDLFSDNMNSRTPQKSLQARLSIEIIKNEDNSVFVRTAKGKFYLRDLLIPHTNYDAVPTFHADRPLFKVYTARRRQPPPPNEHVLVLPQHRFQSILKFQGLRLDRGQLIRRLTRGPLEYMPRTMAESADGYKQVVTYVIVTCGSQVLAFKRGSFSRVAEFLRGSFCIGFGGHVTEEDRTLFSYKDAGVIENAIRELNEELSGNKLVRNRDTSRLQLLGVINDDSSEVGRRHVAIVIRYKIKDWDTWKKVSRGEASVNQLRWLDTKRDVIDLNEYEYWSQLCWRQFFPEVVRAQPTFKVFRKRPFQKAHIVVVVGSIGSGKSLATKYFSERLGYAEVNSGRILAKLLKVRPIPGTSRKQFQKLAWKFISTDKGPERLAKALLRAASELDASRVVIDGVRQLSTLEAIKNFSDVPVAVVFVYAAPDTAFQFYKDREYKGKNTITAHNFLEIMNGSTEREIPHLMAAADAVLYNWMGVANFNGALMRMAEELQLRDWRSPSD